MLTEKLMTLRLKVEEHVMRFKPEEYVYILGPKVAAALEAEFRQGHTVPHDWLLLPVNGIEGRFVCRLDDVAVYERADVPPGKAYLLRAEDVRRHGPLPKDSQETLPVV